MKALKSLIIGTTVLAVSAFVALPVNVSAAAGNNGTVKVDREAFDSNPNNEPHVDCKFQVDFYGYDKGVGDAKVTFELQNPTLKDRTLTVTSGDLTPNIGEDAAGGGTDVDAQETYTLKFTGAQHQKQGYHVKLTVNAPDSKGADVKHKVFWVKPCVTPTEGGHVSDDAATTSRDVAGTSTTAPTELPATGYNPLQAIFNTVAAGAGVYTALLRRK